MPLFAHKDIIPSMIKCIFSISVCFYFMVNFLWSFRALLGDFQHAFDKVHALITLDMQWCVITVFLFLKFYNFIKGIVFLGRLIHLGIGLY